LYVAQLQKNNLQMCALSLIKIMLFSDKDRFFSYTDTSSEISIVMDEETFKEFPEDTLELSPKLYRALEFTSGPSSSAYLVHSMSDPLARAGISIFYISTYETDYTLIAEEDIHRAVDCLRKSFPLLTCNLPNIPHTDRDIQDIVVEDNFTKSAPIFFTRKNAMPNKRKLTVSLNKLVLTSARKHVLPTIGTYIVKFLFFPDKESRFFSYCEANDTISMILDSDEYEKLSEAAGNALGSYNDLWQRISVDDGPLGFDEPGIVDSIANPLARVGVSAFYVSTFETDHLLVRQSQVTTAINTLRNSSFVVNT